MTKDVINVLHLVEASNRGGIEMYLLNVMRRLEGVRFHFTRTEGVAGEMDEEIADLGGRLHPVPAISSSPLAYIRRLKQLFATGNFQVVNAHHPEFTGYMLAYAKKAGIKGRALHAHSTYYGPMEHGIRGSLYKAYGRKRTMSALTRGIAVSREAGNYVFGKDWEKDPLFSLIHCGINLSGVGDEIDKNELRRELSVPPNSLVIGHIGRFTHAKNYPFLLQICGALMKKRGDIFVMLVGDGDLREEVEKGVGQLGIAERVVFTGSRNDVSRLLAIMDLFLFPSRYEGMPLSVVEAQASGTPCVISSVITTEAVICQDKVKRVELDAPLEEWIKACERMLKNPGREASACLEAVKSSDFNIDISAARLTEEYCRTVQGW